MERGTCPAPRFAKLVAGAEDGDARTAGHGQRGPIEHSRERQRPGRQACAGGEPDRTLAQVLPRAANVLPGLRLRVEADRVAFARDVLLHDDGVCPGGQRRAREDAARASLRERRRVLTRAALGGHGEPPGARAAEVLRRDGVPVHRAVIERRQRLAGRQVFGQHAPGGVRERHTLGGKSNDTAEEARAGLVEGQQTPLSAHAFPHARARPRGPGWARGPNLRRAPPPWGCRGEPPRRACDARPPPLA